MGLLAQQRSIPIVSFFWIALGTALLAPATPHQTSAAEVITEVERLLSAHYRTTGERVDLFWTQDASALEAEISRRATQFGSEGLDSSKWLILGWTADGTVCMERSSLPLQSFLEAESNSATNWCQLLRARGLTGTVTDENPQALIYRAALTVLKELQSPLELNADSEVRTDALALKQKPPVPWVLVGLVFLFGFLWVASSHRVRQFRGVTWVITRIPPRLWTLYKLGTKNRAVALVHFTQRRAHLSSKACGLLGISSQEMERLLHSQHFESILNEMETRLGSF